MTQVTDVKPLAAVLTYLDEESNTEVYQEVGARGNLHCVCSASLLLSAFLSAPCVCSGLLHYACSVCHNPLQGGSHAFPGHPSAAAHQWYSMHHICQQLTHSLGVHTRTSKQACCAATAAGCWPQLHAAAVYQEARWHQLEEGATAADAWQQVHQVSRGTHPGERRDQHKARLRGNTRGMWHEGEAGTNRTYLSWLSIQT